MVDQEKDTLLDEKQAAAFLGGATPLSIRTLQSWRFKKIGPSWVSVGPRLVRYSRKTLSEYLASRTVAGTK